MRAAATITSKGQLTLPKSVRERHNLKAGDIVEFREENGRLWMEPRPLRAVDLIGLLGKPPSGEVFTAEELDRAINDATAEAACEEDQRILREWRDGTE